MVSYQPTMLGTRYMCSAGHYLASRGIDVRKRPPFLPRALTLRGAQRLE